MFGLVIGGGAATAIAALVLRSRIVRYGRAAVAGIVSGAVAGLRSARTAADAVTETASAVTETAYDWGSSAPKWGTTDW